MSELELRDTPALEVLGQFPETLGHIDRADIAVAQDLLRLAKKLLGSFGEQFALYGLSPGRYAVLMSLHAGGVSLAPSEIAERLSVTRATVTGLISGLVRDGLVACSPADTPDRRRKAISLSAKGRALLGEVVPDIFIQMAGLVAPLSRQERLALSGLIGKVEGGLSGGPRLAAGQEQDDDVR
jgi:DNA-binding MarR family transcriptional regulator